MAEIDAIFDTCIAQLSAGAAVEACLAQVPAEASELAPLLEIAVALRSLASPAPEVDIPARQQARTRFLAHARALGTPSPVTAEQAFDESLVRIAAGASIDECIDAFPHHATKLRSLLETVVDLQRIDSVQTQRQPAAMEGARAAFLARADLLHRQREMPSEEALDGSILMLTAGATIEACLEAFPKHAATLRPLLETVSIVRQSQQPVPVRSGATVLAGKQAFLTSAAALKGASATPVAAVVAGSSVPPATTLAKPRTASPPTPPWWQRLATLFQQPVWRGALAAVVVLVFLLGFGRTAVTAASGALPGDALFPVKRLAEQTRLVLTVGSQERARVQEQIDQNRRLEAKQVADQGRQVVLQLPGVIASIKGDVWTIFGLETPVTVTSQTGLQGIPGVGKRVLILAWSDGQGNLIARQIKILADDPFRQMPTDTPIPPTSTPTVFGAGISPISPTPSIPTPSSPTPTETPLPTETATAVMTATATLTPTLTPTPSATASPTPSLSPTATPTETPGGPRPVDLTGIIEEIHSEWWLVSGRTIGIDGNTTIDESMGLAEPGAEVRVAGFELPLQGGILARSIEVLQPAGGLQIAEFTGIIVEMNGDIWLVGNTWVDVSGATIQGTPEIGRAATVSAERRGSEMWRATSVRIQEDPEPVYISGVITAIGGSTWQVEGVTIIIDAGTVLTGLPPAVGLLADVTAVERDGGIHALRIYVHAPTATPTITPTITPTPQPPTPTPTPEPPTPTPTPELPTPTPTPELPTPTPTPEPPTPTPTPELPTPTPTPELPALTPTPESPTPTPTSEAPTATPDLTADIRQAAPGMVSPLMLEAQGVGQTVQYCRVSNPFCLRIEPVPFAALFTDCHSFLQFPTLRTSI